LLRHGRVNAQQDQAQGQETGSAPNFEVPRGNVFRAIDHGSPLIKIVHCCGSQTGHYRRVDKNVKVPPRPFVEGEEAETAEFRTDRLMIRSWDTKVKSWLGGLDSHKPERTSI
jgi:hypothetical protein